MVLEVTVDGLILGVSVNLTRARLSYAMVVPQRDVLETALAREVRELTSRTVPAIARACWVSALALAGSTTVTGDGLQSCWVQRPRGPGRPGLLLNSPCEDLSFELVFHYPWNGGLVDWVALAVPVRFLGERASSLSWYHHDVLTRALREASVTTSCTVWDPPLAQGLLEVRSQAIGALNTAVALAHGWDRLPPSGEARVAALSRLATVPFKVSQEDGLLLPVKTCPWCARRGGFVTYQELARHVQSLRHLEGEAEVRDRTLLRHVSALAKMASE